MMRICRPCSLWYIDTQHENCHVCAKPLILPTTEDTNLFRSVLIQQNMGLATAEGTVEITAENP